MKPAEMLVGWGWLMVSLADADPRHMLLILALIVNVVWLARLVRWLWRHRRRVPRVEVRFVRR